MRVWKPVFVSPVLLIAVFLLNISLPLAPAAAYENAELAKSGEAFKAALRKKQGDKTDPVAAGVAWSDATKLARRRVWHAAVLEFEKAAGLGIDDPKMWLEFSIALSQTSPRRYTDALSASWLAYAAAKNKTRQAGALAFIGVYYERIKAQRKALDAYEAGLKLEASRSLQRRFDRLAPLFYQHLKRSYTEVESDTPRICLEFTRNLPAKGKVRFEDFVDVSPDVKPAFSPSGKNLCIEGVAHGTTYDVTVRAGLPDTTGLTLAKTQTFKVAVPDRKESVGFRGATFILPRQSRQGIPISSVNVDKARLQLYRVNDRNLTREINDGRIRRLLSGYDARRLRNQTGELVWQGTVDIRNVKNKQVATAIPAERILKDPKPGIYVLLAAPADQKTRSYQNWATQWLVVSDIGLTSFQGRGGLNAFVRSFDTAEPLKGVEVRLIARNNEVLGSAISDGQGRVKFAPGLLRGVGGARPAALMAFAAKGDFNFLDLLRPAFDLSDRGVGGRKAPGPVDAFLYTERGVYRPGEPVHLVTLLRDDKAAAIRRMPVTIRVFRPDGVEARRYTLRGSDGKDGGYRVTINTSKASRTGRWTARAYLDPKGKSVGTVRFQVEDFVPERLELKLEAERPDLTIGQPNRIKVDGRFLYGAPAADLRVQGEIVLRQDMAPYPDFKGFKFGLVQETWRPKRRELPETKTDAKGQASLPIALDGRPETTRPLKAEVRVSLIEAGGRATARVISLPVRGQPLAIGVKPMAGDDVVGEGRAAAFQIVALDGAGKARSAEGLAYQLYRERYRYHWYYRNNRWNYRLIQQDEPVTKGTLSVTAAKPAALDFKTDWGRYRLEVRDPKTGAATSVRYYVGWFVSTGANTVPDKLSVKPDKASYKAGETAKLHIQPPFSGTVHLVVASDRVLISRNIDVSRSGKTVEVKVDEAWGPGVYVTATAYRPMSQRRKRGPARAIGVAYLARDVSDRVLSVSIEAPEQIKPRRTVDVTVKVEGSTGGRAYVTVAAVDQGILQLTGYKTPAPDTYYFGKRTLAVDIRDDYGRLIDAYAGRLGRVRTGGDAAANRHLGGLDASSIKTVSLFSGIVQVDSDGRAKIPLAVPDFNGRLRIMAVAWTEGNVGKAEKPLIVRDPVVSLVTLPRFLAPGDKGRVTVSLHNVDGAAGQYKVAFETTGGAAQMAAGRTGEEAQLAKDARKTLAFTLEGKTPGVSKINFTLSGPGGFKIARTWDIAVRPAQAVVTKHISQRLEPGETRTYNDALLSEYLPGTGRLFLSFSTYPDFDVPGLVKALDRYPYGCAEQTTSRALPMLYLADVATSVGVAADPQKLRVRIQNAINRVLTMQKRNGGFGLWSANDNYEGWLSAYVLDFLTQARRRGYLVADFVFERGLDRLGDIVNNGEFSAYSLPVRAYALYVLAQNKKARLADLRYVHDTYLSAIPTAIAKAQLAAALALYGDAQRAQSAFASARSHKGRPRQVGRYWRPYYRDYGSNLRDLSGVVYLSSLSKANTAQMPDLVQALSDLQVGRRYTSTQEKAWLLLAVHGLTGNRDPLKVTVGGSDVAERRKPYYLRPAAARLAQGLDVKNRGSEKIWSGITVTGVPSRDLPAESKGFEIRRTFFTLDGKRADLSKVRQSDVLVALIEGRRTSNLNHQALIVDLLPAGFEIENARLGDGRSTKELKWLPTLNRPRHVEPRDDRYVAALDLSGSRKKTFALAYIVRAVTPGSFRLPAVHVEDMYRPQYFARTTMGTVTVGTR